MFFMKGVVSKSSLKHYNNSNQKINFLSLSLQSGTFLYEQAQLFGVL